MPKFRYKAVTAQGKRSNGMLEAVTIQRAREALSEKGLWVTDLIDTNDSVLYRDISLGGPRVGTEHFTVFCRQLATMYRAGVSLVEAIQILSEQTSSKPFAKLLSEIAEDMRGGAQLSDSTAKHPTVFSPIFIHMVHAGEVAGNLDVMLERLAIFFEKERNTKEKVKSAMVYPAIMLVLMIVVVIFLMLFVIPQYAVSFEGMGIELPLPTRIVMAVSEFMQGFWYVVLAAMILPFVLVKIIRRSQQGRERLDLLKLKLPVFGKLWHKQALARFARTFSSLVTAAVPLMQGLTIVSHVVGNEAIGKVIGEIREKVLGGEAMSEPLKQSKLFPPMVTQMLTIGERSGAVDDMLEKVADFYEADVDQMAERLKSLLEPIMIIILTAIVGVIVLAVMTPSFKMMQSYL
ncbi:type II secretion system F family protein [Paenibacillus radicis (ex Gao et al. 2016)]|uniref:Type II secretion system protein F n=1 Tax=Paenibacillus radicis (ex Gao et al. 2016) TaxID=1737354 RepID=A0A917GSQ7_9BACL|nr:type II secretion system F family protein [Paenibacillus radicis (ex Gao et al. 2016)]GGG55481.1 type II secretion system protein F [Paenibacillus radicis (ex Gao et al. 2016)]